MKSSLLATSATLARKRLRCGVALLPLALACACAPAHREELKSAANVAVAVTNYHGWQDSYLMRNGVAEVLIVPRLGRIMQFGFTGEEGVFWQNAALYGKALDCESGDWINFGGDKTWPAPEGAWGKMTGRNSWHPPPAFDCMPLKAEVSGSDVVLISPVDPYYGIRVRRVIRLHRSEPTLTVETSYERVSGAPIWVGIWTITQLREPEGVFALSGASGPVLLMKERPPSLSVADGLASLVRDPASPYKIGLPDSDLLWIGKRSALMISSARSAGQEYPDQGSSTEVYTNPDPLKYVELEMLGPLRDLAPNELISQTNRYRLFHRERTTPVEEARRIFAGRPSSRDPH